VTTLKMNKVDTLPEIARAGRKSEELNMIIAALNESAKDGNSVRIDGIKAGNAYNSMQQRIRAQAKKLGYKIVIRFDSTTDSLFFKATRIGNVKNTTEIGVTAVNNLSAKASEITGVKTKVKTK
jgi:hypothetical protein